MQLRLRPGLSWCLCNGRAVFLDLAQDRYFCLDEARDALFRQWSAGELDGSPVIASQLVDILIAGRGETQPVEHVQAAVDLAESGRPVRAMDVAIAIFTQRQMRRALDRDRLAALVTPPRGPARSTRSPLNDAALERVAAAFHATAGIVTAVDQCLPRALAAHRMCHRWGAAAALVLGVRLAPFAAHAWVQADDKVVVGDLEQVRLYTPILVAP